MKLIIDIPEDVYKRTKFYKEFRDLNDCVITIKALENGTLLPKGHGRLVDADKANKEMQTKHDDCAKTSVYTRLGFETAMEVVNDAPTIIEADKESEEV